MKHFRTRIVRIIATIATAACFAGCSSYTLSGRAVEGDASGIWIVDQADPRLNGPGLAGVAISIKRDPQSLGGRIVANASSDGHGDIRISMEEFGAGWMDEQWEIQAARAGYLSAFSLIELPGKRSDKRMLIVLAPGYEPPIHQEENLIEQYERFR